MRYFAILRVCSSYNLDLQKGGGVDGNSALMDYLPLVSTKPVQSTPSLALLKYLPTSDIQHFGHCNQVNTNTNTSVASNAKNEIIL